MLLINYLNSTWNKSINLKITIMTKIKLLINSLTAVHNRIALLDVKSSKNEDLLDAVCALLLKAISKLESIDTLLNDH